MANGGFFRFCQNHLHKEQVLENIREAIDLFLEPEPSDFLVAVR